MRFLLFLGRSAKKRPTGRLENSRGSFHQCEVPQPAIIRHFYSRFYTADGCDLKKKLCQKNSSGEFIFTVNVLLAAAETQRTIVGSLSILLFSP